jgi:predicted kinase
VDAVNAEEPAKALWRNLAIKHGLTLRIIECHCSDEALHRERLTQRVRGLANFPEPTWESVQSRRLAYTSWSEPVLSIDAASPLETNISRVLAWLEGRG